MFTKGIILLEGPDGSGKSTLAKNLIAANGGGTILHATYRFKDKMIAYHTALLSKALRLSENQLVVMDRHWMSEVVYGEVFRGGANKHSRKFGPLMERLGVLTVVCCGEPHALFTRVRGRGPIDEYEKDYQKFEAVVIRYQNIYAQNFPNYWLHQLGVRHQNPIFLLHQLVNQGSND